MLEININHLAFRIGSDAKGFRLCPMNDKEILRGFVKGMHISEKSWCSLCGGWRGI